MKKLGGPRGGGALLTCLPGASLPSIRAMKLVCRKLGFPPTSPRTGSGLVSARRSNPVLPGRDGSRTPMPGLSRAPTKQGFHHWRAALRWPIPRRHRALAVDLHERTIQLPAQHPGAARCKLAPGTARPARDAITVLETGEPLLAFCARLPGDAVCSAFSIPVGAGPTSIPQGMVWSIALQTLLGDPRLERLPARIMFVAGFLRMSPTEPL